VKAPSVRFMKLLWSPAGSHYTMHVSLYYPRMWIYLCAGRWGQSVLPIEPWCLPQASYFHEPKGWWDCAICTSLKSAIWDETVCGHDEGTWLLFFVIISEVNMFAEIPRRDGHLSVCVHFTIARIHPFIVGILSLFVLNCTQKSLGWQWSSFPPACIRATRSCWLSCRPQMRDEYLQALNTVSYWRINWCFQAGNKADLQPLVNVLASSVLDSISYIQSLPQTSQEDERYRYSHDFGITLL
jgi:hypothetical protein